MQIQIMKRNLRIVLRLLLRMLLVIQVLRQQLRSPLTMWMIPPVITSGTSGTDLDENSGSGQTVYTITATDAVGVSSYAIGGTDASLLTLSGTTVKPGCRSRL